MELRFLSHSNRSYSLFSFLSRATQVMAYFDQFYPSVVFQEMIISDENVKSTAVMSKLKVTRNNETKRGVLCDIAANRMVTTTAVNSKNTATKPPSRLPVLKAQ